MSIWVIYSSFASYVESVIQRATGAGQIVGKHGRLITRALPRHHLDGLAAQTTERVILAMEELKSGLWVRECSETGPL